MSDATTAVKSLLSACLMTGLGVFITGCSTNIPKSLPPQMLPDIFVGPVDMPATAWPAVDWWTVFGNSELSNLMVLAQADNRDLAVSFARIAQAEAQATVLRSSLFPQLTAQADHSSGGCNGQSCQSFSLRKSFDLSFGATYQLDLWGLARNNLRAANEQVKAAKFSQHVVALTVAANTANQYFNVLTLRERIGIANENIAAINAILDVIKLRAKVGSISNLDLAREEAQKEAVESQLPGLQLSEREALFSLAVLLGRVPEGFEVSSGDMNGTVAPTVGPGLPSELLLRRPDVAEAEANLASAHANLDAARAAFFPQFSLTGSGGFVSSAFSTLFQGTNFGYGYGANLLQTIFDGGKLQGQKDLAEATQKEFIARYQSTALNAYADVEGALIEVSSSAKAEAHLQREVIAAKEAFQISQLQYRQGAADLLTVLQAQQTLFSAEDQLARTTLANRQAYVHLFVALGGGWSESPLDRTQVTEAQ
jgi:multidrug efflux system outer membrane protein